MAYTAFGRDALIRPWKYSRNRYIHRAVTLKVPDPTATVSGTISVPGPGRIVAVQYGIKTSAEVYTAATSGTLTLVDSFDAVTKFTDAGITTAQDGFVAVGTTSGDEANAATAATDAFSGGIPIRGDVDVSIASGTANELITVDILVRLCTYARVVLRPAGSAGSAADSKQLRLGNAGVLSAVAVDFGSGWPAATGDVLIKADDATNGTTLWTKANSATDIPPILIGRPSIDEAGAATAATDGTESGAGFKHSLFIEAAGADPYVNDTDEAIVELWIDD